MSVRRTPCKKRCSRRRRRPSKSSVAKTKRKAGIRKRRKCRALCPKRRRRDILKLFDPRYFTRHDHPRYSARDPRYFMRPPIPQFISTQGDQQTVQIIPVQTPPRIQTIQTVPVIRRVRFASSPQIIPVSVVQSSPTLQTVPISVIQISPRQTQSFGTQTEAPQTQSFGTQASSPQTRSFGVQAGASQIIRPPTRPARRIRPREQRVPVAVPPRLSPIVETSESPLRPQRPLAFPIRPQPVMPLPLPLPTVRPPTPSVLPPLPAGPAQPTIHIAIPTEYKGMVTRPQSQFPLSFTPTAPPTVITRPKPVSARRQRQPILIPIETIDRRSCELKFDDYKQQKLLGRGTYGAVFELCDPENKCPYVLKTQQLQSHDPKTYEPVGTTKQHHLDQFKQEVRTQIEVYQKLGITPAVFDAWYCKRNPNLEIYTGFIIMERMDGDLRGYLRRHERDLTNAFIQSISATMSSFIDQLHKIGIAHNDIADRNILYKRLDGGGYKWVLADWGLAHRATTDTRFYDKQLFDLLRYQLFEIQKRKYYVYCTTEIGPNRMPRYVCFTLPRNA